MINPRNNGRYTKLGRKVGKRNFNIIIRFACHARHTCSCPKSRYVQLTKKIVKVIWNNLRFINFSIKRCVDTPKWIFNKLNIIKSSFTRQQYTLMSVYSLINKPHYTTAPIYRNTSILKMLVVSPIANFQHITQEILLCFLSYHVNTPRKKEIYYVFRSNKN